MANPFVEAIETEQRLREEAYLDAPHFICGIPLHQITPRILAVLFRIETPFLGAGDVDETEIARFLWACHVDNPNRREPARWFRKSTRDRFAASLIGIDFALTEAAIWEFLDVTFLDAPSGGGAQRPYVCSIAAMQYSMAHEPFSWDCKRTLDEPLRVIYQLMRCRMKENGQILKNRISDPVMQSALDEMNTPEAMADRAREFREKHFTAPDSSPSSSHWII